MNTQEAAIQRCSFSTFLVIFQQFLFPRYYHITLDVNIIKILLSTKINPREIEQNLYPQKSIPSKINLCVFRMHSQRSESPQIYYKMSLNISQLILFCI